MVRTAQESDFGRLGQLYAQLNPADPPMDTPEGRETFRRILADEAHHLFVMEDCDGLVQSTCYLNIIPNLSRGASAYGVIENVVTDQSARGQGFGKSMITHALEYAWREDCYKVMLLTGTHRAGTKAFYTACGFDGDEKAAFVARRSANP